MEGKYIIGVNPFNTLGGIHRWLEWELIHLKNIKHVQETKSKKNKYTNKQLIRRRVNRTKNTKNSEQ